MHIEDWIKILPQSEPEVDECDGVNDKIKILEVIYDREGAANMVELYEDLLAQKSVSDYRYKQELSRATKIKNVLTFLERFLLLQKKDISLGLIPVKERLSYSVDEALLDDEYKVTTVIKQINMPLIKSDIMEKAIPGVTREVVKKLAIL